MNKRTNKRMKQMAAAMMAGMLAMCTGTGIVQAEEGEGWAVEGSCSACIPIEEYAGDLEYAPATGYAIDVQFVNSDTEDVYVTPQFTCAITNEDLGEEFQMLLLGTNAVYTPDSGLPQFSLRTQQPLLVPAGEVINATYFIDFGEDYEVGVCEPVYGTDDETAYDNSYVLTGHEEYSFGDVQMGHYVNTVEDMEAMAMQMQAAYEEVQAAAEAEAQAQAEAQAAAEAQAQAQNQAAYEEEQRQAEKDELLGEIVSDLGGKAIDRTSGWIEEETNGVFDRELQGKIVEYLFK